MAINGKKWFEIGQPYYSIGDLGSMGYGNLGMGWDTLKYAGLGCNRPEQVGMGWNMMEQAEIGLRGLELDVIRWNWLDQIGKAWSDWEWLKISENSPKLLEMRGMAENG